MASKIRAGRYAQAVFEIALEKKELDIWQSDLRGVAALGQYPEIVSILENPKIASAKKVKLLAELLPGMNAMVMNLVQLLISRGRFALVIKISEEYQRRLDSYRGVGKAEVVTAVPLSEDYRTNLAERLSALFNKKIELTSGVNTSLIGGIVVRVNGKLLDGSTSSKLAALKSELAGAG